MSITFNADEVFQMAEQIERNGAKYYRRAAEIVKDQEARQIFISLADMEDTHEKTFAEMHSKLTAKESEPTVYDPEELTGKYIKALADGRVFDMSVDPAAELTGDESIVDVLKTALSMEKESIVFYTGLKMYVPESLGHKQLDLIIEEEFSHITLIDMLLNTWG